MMTRLRFLTAGESHGKVLTGIIEGIPAGFEISVDEIDWQLKRRQGGYGRGGRMKIESDRADIISGIRWGKTIGSPISIIIENKDWQNWKEAMSSGPEYAGSLKAVTKPRPGHADLAGALKYNQTDIRNILERSSARETAMRVALGSVARQFLSEFGIKIGSYVTQIGSVKAALNGCDQEESGLKNMLSLAERSEVRCPDSDITKKMMRLIDKVIKDGDSLGGVFEIFATGLPVGLGSHIQWDKKLDARLAAAFMGIQAIKGVEIGQGFKMASEPGSCVMDEIYYDKRKKSFYRKTNNAGGIEGGMTNGMPLIIRAVMKPIPTQRKPLISVDMITKKPVKAAYERSDVCAVPAASVVGEAMAALVIADAFLEKFGGDSKKETMSNYKAYADYVKRY